MAPEGDDQSRVIAINGEQDIVFARRAGMELCARLGFSGTDQVKVATAISELARNILLYAGTGRVTVRSLKEPRPGIEVVAQDEGLGFVFDERRRQPPKSRGMGLGLVGTKRLMDDFHLDSQPGPGTTITIRKYVNR